MIGRHQGPTVDVHQKTLVLAGNRTRRPDILRGFKRYQGGWDFTNKHYWAAISVNYCGSSNASFCPSWSRDSLSHIWTSITGSSLKGIPVKHGKKRVIWMRVNVEHAHNVVILLPADKSHLHWESSMERESC
ncbi:hypothetical protein Ancab_011455 [Ancistrocladus abbreviatus]